MKMRIRSLVLCGILALVPLVALAGEAGRDDKGFFIKEGEFSLYIGGFVQFKADYLEGKHEYSGDFFRVYMPDDSILSYKDTKIDPKANFTVRRARVNFSGKAFKPWLNFMLEVDYGQGVKANPGQTAAADNPKVTDAYLGLNFSDTFNLRLGQFKVPFDLFNMINDRAQMFVEAPVGTDLFSPKRDVGIMYTGNSKDKRITWNLGVFNGAGSNKPQNDNSKQMIAARIEYQNAGGFKYRATAVDHPKKAEYTVGLAFLSNGKNVYDGGLTDPNGSDCVPGLSTKCEYITKNVSATELFGAYRISNFQISGTYQMWDFNTLSQSWLAGSKPLTSDNPEIADSTKLKVNYFNVEAGLFVTDRMEVGLRLSQWKHKDSLYFFDGTTRLLSKDPLGVTQIGKTDYKVNEIRLGFNYYFAGNNAKVMVDLGQEETTVDKNAHDFFPKVGGTGTAKYKASGLRTMFSFFF